MLGKSASAGAALLVAFAASAQESGDKPVRQEPIEVKGSNPDWALRRDHLLPEVDRTNNTITVTKRSSVSRLEEQPPIADNNLREMFARIPGLMISEQQTPTQFNLNYRGIGNPQESEYILTLQDGIPIVSDWIGFPTLYYMPFARNVEGVQLIRGGSSLLYGPEPGPVVNFVSAPPFKVPMGASSENIWGSHGLFTTFNTLSGTNGPWNYRLNLAHRESDGWRRNNDDTVNAADVHVGYQFNGVHAVTFDYHAYSGESGEAGKMSYTQYQIDRTTATTPYNRAWIDRNTGILTYEYTPGDRDKAIVKVWSGAQDLSHRTAAGFVPPQPPPATTVLENQDFRYTGVDARLLHRWDRGNAFTAGFVYYESRSPWRQYTTTNLEAPREDTSGTPRLSEDRHTKYGALFAENVFRYGVFHFVPSVRYDAEEIRISETVKPPNLTRPFINKTYRKQVPLFGIGAGHDFGPGNETYANISQGYRPLRYLDVAGPFGNLAQSNNPDPPESVSYEVGVHGWPQTGLYYDVGLFYVDFKNRIESQALNATDTINVNTGNSIHKGIELEGSYDLARPLNWSSAQHLALFANASFLNARFVSSANPALVGRTPAFAPKFLVRAGLLLREDNKYKVGATFQSVASQYWQDSGQSFGSGATFVPATIPAYSVLDVSAEVRVTKTVRILGGVGNATDRVYYSRVFQNTIEPAPRRGYYAGIAIDL